MVVFGTTLTKLDGSPYLSRHFERCGFSAVFRAQILNVSTAGDLTIDIEHKNADETSFSLLISFATASVPSLIEVDTIGNGIKEQLRFKYTVGGSSEYDAVTFLMLAPTWRLY